MRLRMVLGTTTLGLALVAACSGSSPSSSAEGDAGGGGDATTDHASGNPEASPPVDGGATDATADSTAPDVAVGDVVAPTETGVADAHDANPANDANPGSDASDASDASDGSVDAPPEAAATCTGLDPTFGTQGIVTLPSPPDPNPQSPSGMVLQPDGKIVVIGAVPAGSQANSQLVAIARYGSDGSLDATFGNSGRVVLAPIAGSTYVYGTSLALQPDGRILVAGYDRASGGVTTPFLLRLDAIGGLDTSFGTAGYAAAPAPNVSFSKILLRPSTGAILAVGSRGTTQHQYAVAQYTASGALDTAFGTGGFVTTALAGDANSFAAALQADGKLIVGGEDTVAVDGGYAYPIQLARYTTAGTLDPTFGTAGLTSPPSLGASGPIAVTGVVVQSTGAIVATLYPYFGGPSSDFFVTRYTPSGQMDTTFGTNGVTQTHFADARSFTVDVSLLAGDAVLVSGIVEPAADASVGASQGILGLARYTAGGAPDTTFGTGGTVVLPIPGEKFAYMQGQVLQPDHKLVAALSSGSRNTADGGIIWVMNLLRYCP